MAITRTIPRRFLIALLLATVSTVACAAKSNKAASASPLPKDPAALLALAAQSNGLTGPGLKPWHIKATYQLYDATGKPTEAGTFEEWWASPSEYKITFDRPNFHFEFYLTPQGAYFSKNATPEESELRLIHWLIDPMPDSQNIKGYKLKQRIEKSGHNRFDCLEMRPTAKRHSMKVAAPKNFCLSAQSPTLRFVEILWPVGPYEILYKSLAELQGQSLGEDLSVGTPNRLKFTAHLDSGELLLHPDDATFTPPQTAKQNLTYSPATTKHTPFFTVRQRLAGHNPNYPYMAKTAHQQGTVQVDAIIGADGSLHNLKAVSSPGPALTDSAIKALQTWRFRPYKLSGIPIPVKSSFQIVYTLGVGI